MTTSIPGTKTSTSAPQLWRPTPLKALERAEVPSELHFVRDHFAAPVRSPGSWSLQLTGAARSVLLDVEALRRLPQRTISVVLECAGHRRGEFEPVPPGVPWATGAVAEARWTGTSLGALLERAGLPADTREVVLEGADCGQIDGAGPIHTFARSLPLSKALDPDVLLAYEMNGQPISVARGGPVRVIVPGWYATDSVKWLDRIWFSDEEFDGAFQAHDYRIREPGEPGLGQRMTDVPVHALITTPAENETAVRARELSIRGIAWGGAGGVAEVLVSVDRGPWLPTRLAPKRGPYTRVHWEARAQIAAGAHELACRAVDGAGSAQPEHPPNNVDGYANNAIHRVSFIAV